MICTTSKGKEFLKNYMDEFSQLEYQYNNIGLTRLKAMKELLKCLVVLITEQTFANGDLPFAKKNPDGKLMTSFENTLRKITSVWKIFMTPTLLTSKNIPKEQHPAISVFQLMNMSKDQKFIR